MHPSSPSPKLRLPSLEVSTELKPWIIAAVWVYFTVLFGWLATYLLTGDRIGYVALVNTLAVYLFLPLPFVLVAAPFLRRLEIWGGGLIGVLTFAWLWGGLFTPELGDRARPEPRLRVMTYNVLGNHFQIDAILANIAAADPDVVLIQELNPELALALEVELVEVFPYQILDPRPGVVGMGTISKYPLQPRRQELPLNWVGDPQEMVLEWGGSEIVLVNFHMFPSGLGYPRSVEAVYRARETQAQALAAYVSQVEGPLIAGGDANVTHLSTAYRIFTADLQDAWQAAGWGFGHTFPGSDIPGSSRPRIAGRPVPKWLARIDYVLFSSHWRVVRAEMAPFDGVSDHRGVLAAFQLIK